MRQQADPNFGKRKKEPAQQAQQDSAAAGGDMPPPPAKRPRTAATGANAQEAAPAAGRPQAAQPEQQAARQQPEAAAGAAPSAPAEQQLQEQGQGEGAGAQQEGQQQEQQAPRLQGAWRQQRHTAANTAFVKHLADEVDEAAVKQLFAGCPGGVASVELGRDKKTGRSRVRCTCLSISCGRAKRAGAASGAVGWLGATACT